MGGYVTLTGVTDGAIAAGEAFMSTILQAIGD
jgi:hypothetical protein